MKTDKIKNELISELINHGGSISFQEFDETFFFTRYGRKGRERGKYLSWPPIWFICDNSDRSLAFYMWNMWKLCETGLVFQKDDSYTLGIL